MIGQALDYYSYYHIIGGFALGLWLGLYHRRGIALALIVILVIGWEVVEANFLASWLGLIELESLINSLSDIALTVSFGVFGVFVAHSLGWGRRGRELSSRELKRQSGQEGELWGGLRRAWKGFKAAKARGDKRKMREYAEAINTFQGKLGLKKTRFRGLE
jgi:hypothetical protein